MVLIGVKRYSFIREMANAIRDTELVNKYFAQSLLRTFDNNNFDIYQNCNLSWLSDVHIEEKIVPYPYHMILIENEDWEWRRLILNRYIFVIPKIVGMLLNWNQFLFFFKPFAPMSYKHKWQSLRVGVGIGAPKTRPLVIYITLISPTSLIMEVWW